LNYFLHDLHCFAAFGAGFTFSASIETFLFFGIAGFHHLVFGLTGGPVPASLPALQSPL